MFALLHPAALAWRFAFPCEEDGTTKGTKNTKMDRDSLEALAKEVVDSAIEVHRTLGPGLLESAYEAVLCTEFAQREIAFERQVPLPVKYKGVTVDCGYRLDVLVSGEIILELKAVGHLLPVHEAQILSYLKIGRAHV